ncbi:MAG: hypothetical protein ACOVK2_03400 [Candidatus Fonsibacter sp.]
MENTISYSNDSQGWTSFFSYIPENMIGMNSYFYSFKRGNLYRHNSDDVDRNNFYGTDYPSKITTVFNADQGSVKNFNTISLNSEDAWDCSILTDLSTGSIDHSYFELKEGDYFAYIRSNSGTQDLNLRSTQGIGVPISINSTVPAAVVVTFNYSLGSIITIGSDAYKNNAGVPLKLGKIVNKGDKTITINTTGGGSIPLVSDFIFYFQNAVAESYGVRGYYMQIELENNNKSRVEMFSIGSSIFKSLP